MDRDDPCARVNFIVGDCEDDAKHYAQYSTSIIPRIGDEVTIASTRDEHGNYVHKHAKTKFSGIVKRVEHHVEERGSDSRSWSLVHFVNVYMDPLKRRDGDSEPRQ